MVRVSKRDWPALAKKINYVDPVLVQDETERKKKVDLEILMNVGTVQDRQSLEYWLNRKKELDEQKKKEEEEKEMKAKKKQDRNEKIIALVKKVVSGSDKKKPAASSGSKKKAGKTGKQKSRKPFEGPGNPEREVPDFNPPGWAR